MSDSSRFEQEFTITSTERGKLIVKMVDRINVDDVFLHLVNREVYRLKTGVDAGDEVEPMFKEFLLKERFTAGQG
jgi:hypothetical protein